MMERIDGNPGVLHNPVQQRIFLNQNHVRGIFSGQILTMLYQGLVMILRGKVLKDFSAQCASHHLYTPANAQNGQLAVIGHAHQPQFSLVTLGANSAKSGKRFIAHEQRVHITTSGKQQSVNPVQGGRKGVHVLIGRNDQRDAAGLQHRLIIPLRQFTTFFAKITRNTDYWLLFAHGELAMEFPQLPKPIIAFAHDSSSAIGLLSLRCTPMGTSFFILCFREISVSVVVTPGISCKRLFKSSIRWALSLAYSFTSMV